MRRRGSSCSADSSPAAGSRPASRFLAAPLPSSRLGIGALVLGLVLVLGLAMGSAASAESPTAVAEDLAIDGVYVAPGRADIDETMIAESIREARARGLRLVVVAPIDPQPSAEAFARRVLEASDADAALVFPPDGGL
ncbi:MAG: hypothetical protein ACR2QO_15160, partial [Acidimicrobiales bacterium]